jgi:hypothetical protein
MLVALASASVGAVAGAFVAASMSATTGAGAAGPSAKESAAAIGDVLEPRFAALQHEVAALRAELAAARRTSASGETPARGAPNVDAAPHGDAEGRAEILDAIARLASREAAPSDRDVFSRSADDPAAPQPRVDHLAALHGWATTTAIRAKWLFLKESAALEWFGTPRRIGHDKDDDSYDWYYDIPTPTAQSPDETKTIFLVFRRGRLVDVSDYGD